MAGKITQTTAAMLAALGIAGMAGAPAAAMDRALPGNNVPALIAPVRNLFTVYAADYAVDLPNYWKDRVNVAVDGNTIVVTSRQYPDRELATITLADDDHGTVLVDDLGYSLIATLPVDGGLHVEIWAPRWEYLSMMGYETLSEVELGELVDLQSGGLPVDDIDDELFAMDDWLRANLTLAA